MNESHNFKEFEEEAEDELWDMLESDYGRPLTTAELRDELSQLEGRPLTNEEFEDALRDQAAWKALKAKWAEQEAEITQIESENALREKNVAKDLHNEIHSPPVNDDGTMGEAAGLAWIERVNEIIRTRLDFYSLCELMNIGSANQVKQKAFRMALKRHSENQAMKAEVFVWLDSNMANFKSMDAAAQAAIKQQPIAFRTARDWVGEWKKVRSAGTP